VFRAIKTPEERVQAFLAGEVDLITYMTLDHRQAFLDAPSARIIERETAFCVIIMFNSQQGPCQDRLVRQALNYATDVDEIIRQVAFGKAHRMNGPLSPFHSASDPDLEPYPYDLQKARLLLKEAGYSDGISLTIHRPTSSPSESAVLVALLKEQWAKAGISVDEKVFENREAYALLVREKQIGDMGVFDSSPLSSYRVLREKLHSGFTGPWWQGYHNEEVNHLMEKAWETPDEDLRTAIYRQAYRIIQQDAPWLFLYCPYDMWVVRDLIKEALPDWGPGISGLVLFGQ
ncbi:MAG TPA: ABC transporter substrate-binding protein, partial [Bacteroidales bacterium]|nr:ABC transporter substrate-binding protein [Bacteroidales bacterium]